MSVICGYALRIPITDTNFIIVTDVMVILLSVVWFFKKFKTFTKINILSFDVANLLLLFAFISFISLLFGTLTLNLTLVEFLISFFYLIRFIAYTMIFFITMDIYNDIKSRLQLIKFLFYIDLVIVVLGFLQLIFYPDFTYMAIMYGWDPHKDRLLSTFFDPNYLAGFFALNCGLAMTFLFNKNINIEEQKMLDKYLPTFFLFFIFLFTFVALILTLSRSGFLAFIIIAIIIFWYRAKIFIFIGLVCIAAIIWSSEKVQDRIIGAFSLDTTSIYRVQSWINAFDIAMERPIFGHGYNTLRYLDEDINVLSTSSKNASSGSDSSLLNILLMTGFVGLFIYISIFVSIFRESYLSFLYSKSAIQSSLGLFITCMIISLFVHSWFVNSLLYPYILLFFWVIVGLFYSTFKDYKKI